jgi:prevent-host-death family protein
MRSVGAKQAGRTFSRLLAAVENGEKFLITSHGRAVAILSPFYALKTTTERRIAINHAITVMTKGLPWDDEIRHFERDEMYET